MSDPTHENPRCRAFSLAALALLAVSSISFAADPTWERATPFGGPLSAVAEAPSANFVLYAVAQNGRFYSSRSNGLLWERRALLPTGVEELQVAPQDFLTVYARTPSRLLRSRNGGQNWKDLRPAVLALDPIHFGVLYAATEVGLLRSTDHGDSFAPWAFAGQPLAAVAIDPHTPSTLFAITSRKVGDETSSIWKSLDDGRTWAPTGITVTPTTFDGKLSRFVFDPEHAGTLYAAFGNGDKLDPIFRTTNGGSTWTPFAEGLGLFDLAATTNGKLVGASFLGTSRSRDGGATWNPPLPFSFSGPAQPRDQLVRLAPSAVPERVLGAGDAGFWMSSNAGAAWTFSNQGILAQGIDSLAVAPSGPPTVYVTAGYGLFRSTDEGATWDRRYSSLGDLSQLSIEAFHPTLPRTIYATGDDGQASFVARSKNGGLTWSRLPVPYDCDSGGSVCEVGMAVAGLDPHDPDALYVAGHYFFHFSGMGDFLLRSSDGFTTSKALTPLHRLGTLIVDAEQADTLYGITCTGFHRSLDGGKKWQRLGTGLPASICPEGLDHPVMVRDPEDGRKFYVGTLSKGVFASVDGGQTFRPMNRGLESAVIRSLLIDPQDPTRLYVGSPARGVFQWHADQAKWLPLNGGLPLAGYAGVVALDPQNPTRLYAASPSLGVYRLDL